MIRPTAFSKPDRNASEDRASARRSTPSTPNRLKLGSFLLVSASAIVGWILLRPYFSYATIPLGVFVNGVLLLIWFKPSWLLRRPNVWLITPGLFSGIAALLSLLQPGLGGRFGDFLSSGDPALGTLKTSLLFLSIPIVLFPVRTLRLARALATKMWWGVRYFLILYKNYPAHRLVPWLLRGLLYLLSILPKLIARQLKRTLRLSTATRKKTPVAEDPLVAALSASKGIPSSKAVWDDKDSSALTVDQPTWGPVHKREHGGRLASELLTGKRDWTVPPITLLTTSQKALVPDQENQDKAEQIVQTLSDYGIEVTVREIRPGPVVTQFGVVPGWSHRYQRTRSLGATEGSRHDRDRRPPATRVKVDTILSREKDLALALAAPSIRIEAPVPGEGFVGIEVPNATRTTVNIRSLLESEAFKKIARDGALPIALGEGSGGEPVVADLAEMPHLLIAGATGSGKSVCMNAIICCLMMHATPLELRLLMIDPKRVELTPFNGIPHLLTPVIVEAEDTASVLQGLIAEMKARYRRLEAASVRNIQSFNRKQRTRQDHMPYLVTVVDELADLMMIAPGEVEHRLTRLAQLGRATGIHLVVATQRPSVNVITGLIKANFPSRIAFSVSSNVDSRTILDSAGAEKLLGKGDMLFLPGSYPKSKRLQGAYVSSNEADAVINHWKRQEGPPPPYIQLEPEEGDGSTEDELMQQAIDVANSHTRVSASLLQRKLGVGSTRAIYLLDLLEEKGIVAPGEIGRSRVVITRWN